MHCLAQVWSLTQSNSLIYLFLPQVISTFTTWLEYQWSIMPTDTFTVCCISEQSAIGVEKKRVLIWSCSVILHRHSSCQLNINSTWLAGMSQYWDGLGEQIHHTPPPPRLPRDILRVDFMVDSIPLKLVVKIFLNCSQLLWLTSTLRWTQFGCNCWDRSRSGFPNTRMLENELCTLCLRNIYIFKQILNLICVINRSST